MKTRSYTEDELRELESIDAIRMRPGMYVGGTDQHGLQRLICQPIEDAIIGVFFGHLRSIVVTLLDDGFVRLDIEDDGLPIASDGTPLHLEKIMTNTGYRFSYVYTVPNALSAELTVTTRRDGYVWQQHYQEGVKTTEVMRLRQLAPNESTGTTLLFKPEPTIFSTTEIDVDLLAARLREITYLMVGFPITLNIEQDTREHQNQHFCFPRGLSHLVTDILPTDSRSSRFHHPTIHAKRTIEIDSDILKNMDRGAWASPTQMSFEIALQFRSSPQIQFAYCNLHLNIRGGTHLNALREGIMQEIKVQARRENLHKFSKSDVLSHVVAVVSVLMPNPHYDNASTEILNSTEVREPILQLTRQAIHNFALEQPDQMTAILNGLEHHGWSRRYEANRRREKRSRGKSAN